MKNLKTDNTIITSDYYLYSIAFSLGHYIAFKLLREYFTP